MSGLLRSTSVHGATHYADVRNCGLLPGGKSQPLLTPALKFLEEEETLFRSCTEPMPLSGAGTLTHQDRAWSDPSGQALPRYVAYAANPFRADLHGNGSVFLPRQLQACLDKKLAEHGQRALCNTEQDSCSEAEFHEVMEEVRIEVAKEGGPVDSYGDMFLALMSAMVVNPLILMPFYTSLNGVAVSAGIVAVVTAIQHTCSDAIHHCLDELASRVPASVAPPLARDYAFVAYYALGRMGSIVAIAFYTGDYWSANISNMVILDKLWGLELPPSFQELPWVLQCAPLLVHGAIAAIMLYVPSSIFRHMPTLGCISLLVMVAALAVQAASRFEAEGISAWTSGFEKVSAKNVMLEVVTVIFTYGNVPILPKITLSWQGHAKERAGLLKGSFVTSGIVYAVFGMLGAIAFNPASPDSVIMMKGLLGRANQLFFILKIQGQISLLMSPCIHVLQDVLAITRRSHRICSTFAFICFNVCVAKLAGGQLETVMSLTGATVTTSLCLVFPPAMRLRLCSGGMSALSKAAMVLVALLGACCALAGTYYSWLRLVETQSAVQIRQ